MVGTNLPLAALLLATAVTLLAATSAVPVAAAAAAAEKYSGRIVIIRSPGARVVSAGGALNKWQQRRLVEDEVAPELDGVLGAGDPGIAYRVFNPNSQVCLQSPSNCARPGGPYAGRPCGFAYRCNSTPSARHASAVHV